MFNFPWLEEAEIKTQYQPKILIDQSIIQKLKETLANIENKNNSLQAALIGGWKNWPRGQKSVKIFGKSNMGEEKFSWLIQNMHR